MSSFDPIEINDGKDPEIEDFLVQEDPELQGFKREVTSPTEPYEFMTNFPPCLQGKEGFSSIKHDLKQTTYNIDAPVVDYVLHQSTTSPVHCDDCYIWVEHYYTDIPILHAQIKTLTS